MSTADPFQRPLYETAPSVTPHTPPILVDADVYAELVKQAARAPAGDRVTMDRQIFDALTTPQRAAGPTCTVESQRSPGVAHAFTPSPYNHLWYCTRCGLEMR